MKTVGQADQKKKTPMALGEQASRYLPMISPPKNCLIVKVLRSPHANAMVRSVKKDLAEKGRGDRSGLYLGGCAR